MSGTPSAARRTIQGLRAKIALLVGVPILVALVSFSFSHYWRARHLADMQAQSTAEQIGTIALSTLNYATMTKDHCMLASALIDVADTADVQSAQIIDLHGQVICSSSAIQVGAQVDLSDTGCQECHQFSLEDRPQSIHLNPSEEILRVGTAIDNQPACQGCHAGEGPHLGMLVMDVSHAGIHQQLLDELSIDLALSLTASLLLSVGIYLLTHRLVVRRVESFRPQLARLSAGDFSARLPCAEYPSDELGELALTFNRMASDLEEHAREKEQLSQVRLAAVIEERERIARELHDGLAQLLGYVNSKAAAVRLLLQKGKPLIADEQLSQLEEASRSLLTDVREAILGLRLASTPGSSLARNLETLAAQFSRLSGLPVSLSIAPGSEDLSLPTETELNLLRICQEALTNVRKHAQANQASVRLDLQDGELHLIVEDDGVGFELPTLGRLDGTSYGLDTMHERAQGIGADLSLETSPGQGTRIAVYMVANKV